MMKNKHSLRTLLLLLSLPIAIFAFGCADDNDDLGDAMDEAGDEMQDAADDTRDAIEDATN